MKVYWVAGKGAVIGSANLSTNALGVAGLSECAVWVPASTIDIDALIRSVPHKPMTEGRLAKLQRQDDLFWSRNTALLEKHSAIAPPQSFVEWSASHKSFPWLLSWWDAEGNEAASTAKAVDQDFGTAVYEFIDCNKGQFTEGDWVLLYRLLKNDLPGRLSWLFVSRVYPVPPNERADDDYTHQAVQVGSLRGRRPPFRLTPTFQSHFRAAVKEYGASKLATQEAVTVPPSLLADLRRRSGLTTALS